MLPFIQSAYFQNLLDGYPESVAIFNTDGYAYACNRHAREMLGIIGEEDFKGLLWDEFLPGIEEPDTFRRYMADARNQKGRREALEAVYITLDGDRLRLSLTTSLLVEYGKIFGILLSMTDVTHIYAMHARQRRFLEERHAMELARTRSLRTLSDAVAHQLRNPAMAIAGFARIALRKSDQALHEYLEGILDESVRLEAIVQAVTSYNAIRTAEPRHILLPEIAARVADEAYARGPESWRAIPLLLDVEETAVTVDADLTVALLTELVCNSLEAIASMPRSADAPPGEVYLGAGMEDGLRYEVADTGPGIAADILPFVFDPFFTTMPDKVGMGLARVRRMAAELGLDITVHRREPGGVLITLDEDTELQDDIA
ncbi:PAS domain-containing sensor histidine kinase [Oceanidesulfovibrio marinus]|uniref:PAS domain-containing sensor histidine kinase n=1 Tax=Oceanidesulfovibrio marinus TaxID=370038 RepID=UPI00142F1094|nr:PAS domain-containing sensor histidine kinase [Oceanidesulfovibrio marinus]